jgi:hypothetical protein
MHVVTMATATASAIIDQKFGSACTKIPRTWKDCGRAL